MKCLRTFPRLVDLKLHPYIQTVREPPLLITANSRDPLLLLLDREFCMIKKPLRISRWLDPHPSLKVPVFKLAVILCVKMASLLLFSSLLKRPAGRLPLLIKTLKDHLKLSHGMRKYTYILIFKQGYSSSNLFLFSATYKQRDVLHAGMAKKPLGPYNPNAQRSQLPKATIVMPYKNSS